MVQGRWAGIQDTKGSHRGKLYWYLISWPVGTNGKTRNAPSLAKSRSVDVSSPASSSPLKCTVPSSSGNLLSLSVMCFNICLFSPYFVEQLANHRRDYLHYVKKYNRYEKRHKNLAAHVSPCFRVKEGDYVTVGQCRPLSKTVRFNLLKINRSDEGSKQFGKF